MKIYGLVVAVLAVWRATHLLQAEDGPWKLVLRLRRAAGSGFWAGLMDCFHCLSLWLAAPVALLLGQRWEDRLLLWLAVSGGAILLQRATSQEPAPPVPSYREDPEEAP